MGYDSLLSTVPFTVVQVSSSCLGNQNKELAAAGIGVFFAPDHKFNLSEPLQSGPQTNQRAILIAAYRAMRQAKQLNVENLIIQTNSRYLVDNMNYNIHHWRKNNFMTSKGSPVVNAADFLRMEKEIQNKFRFVLFEYVNKDENEVAHFLAVEGAKIKRMSLLSLEE